MSTETATFDINTWALGTRGTIRPNATNKPKLVNVQMYPNGILGPRSLWQFLHQVAEPTGLPSTAPLVLESGYLEDDKSMTYGLLVIGEDRDPSFIAWNVGFDTMYNYVAPVTSLDVPFYGSGAPNGVSRPSLAAVSRVNEYSWLIDDTLVVCADQTTGTNPQITATTVLTDVLARSGAAQWYCRGSVVHTSRAFYWGAHAFSPAQVSGLANRVWYSNARVADTDLVAIASADQWFDLDSEVAGAVSLGSNLLFWTKDATWWMLSGFGDPDDRSLYKLASGRIPAAGRPASPPAIMDGKAYFTTPGEELVTVVDSQGNQDDVSLRDLGFYVAGQGLNTESLSRGVGSSIHNTLMLTDGWEQRHFSQGVWTEQQFYHSNGRSADIQNCYGIADYAGVEFIANIGDVLSDGLLLFKRPLSVTYPTDQSGTSGNDDGYDLTTGKGIVGLPRVSHPSRPSRVRRVTIDGIMYGSDADVQPSITVKNVTDVGTVVFTSVGPAQGFNVKIAADTATGAETPFRAVYTPTNATGYSAYSDVTLYDMVQVGIERVTVEYEVLDARTH